MLVDDTTVIGLISNSDEIAYRADVQYNNLLRNTSKTKELIIGFRKERGSTHSPFHLNRTAVECVPSFKFLGTYISEGLCWITSTANLAKKAHQRLFFLKTYWCAIEHILTSCGAVWYGNCAPLLIS